MQVNCIWGNTNMVYCWLHWLLRNGKLRTKESKITIVVSEVKVSSDKERQNTVVVSEVKASSDKEKQNTVVVSEVKASSDKERQNTVVVSEVERPGLLTNGFSTLGAIPTWFIVGIAFVCFINL